MPEVILNGSRIVPIARELVSRAMAQHVRMNLKGQSGLLTRALHQPIEPIGRERIFVAENPDRAWPCSPAQIGLKPSSSRTTDPSALCRRYGAPTGPMVGSFAGCCARAGAATPHLAVSRTRGALCRTWAPPRA